MQAASRSATGVRSGCWVGSINVRVLFNWRRVATYARPPSSFSRAARHSPNEVVGLDAIHLVRGPIVDDHLLIRPRTECVAMDGHAYRHPRMRMLEIEEVGAHFRRPAIEKALDELVDGAAADVGYGLLGERDGNPGAIRRSPKESRRVRRSRCPKEFHLHGSERPTSDKGMPRPRYPLRKSVRSGIDVT